MATVNPAAVLGPVLGPNFSDSIQIVQRMLAGKLPFIPNLGFCIVDVRDVAKLHLMAMKNEQAVGERFIAAGNFLWAHEMAQLLRKQFPKYAKQIPTRKGPDFLLRIASLFQRELRVVTPWLSKKRVYSSQKAKERLGWTPISVEQTFKECGQSLIERNLV